MDKEYKRKKYFVYIWVAIIIGFLSFIIYKSESNNKEDVVTENGNKLVTDYSLFFTIDGCAKRYIEYLASSSKERIMNVLDNTYKKVNNITLDNVLDKVDDLDDGHYKFQTMKIYYKELNDSNQYYVYGTLSEEVMDDIGESTDYYLLINMDEDQLLFSVTPYDGKVFKGDM